MKLFIYLLSILDRIHDFFVPKKDLILPPHLQELYVPDEEDDD